jgi:ribosomal protein S8
MTMAFEKKYIYRPITGKVNYDAKRLLNISTDEYLYLDLINQYQDKSGTGWAELNKANNYTKISDFKIGLANFLGIKDRTMYNLFKKMKERGYIEEKMNGFRVTENFWILKGEGEQKSHTTPTPSVSKEDAKTFFSDSPYMDFEFFKHFIIKEFAKETDLDIAYLHERIKNNYTILNVKPYTNWGGKITDWVKKDIFDGSVRRIKKSETKEAIIAEIKTYKTMAESITDIREYKKYRDTIETLIFWTEKAHKANWLNETQIERLEELKKDFSTGGALKKRLEKQITVVQSLPSQNAVDLSNLTKSLSMDG